LWHFRRLPLFRQYKYGHGKLLLKVLRRKSFLMSTAEEPSAAFLPQVHRKVMAGSLEIMASP
jgi:hypothetical protein